MLEVVEALLSSRSLTLQLQLWAAVLTTRKVMGEILFFPFLCLVYPPFLFIVVF